MIKLSREGTYSDFIIAAYVNSIKLSLNINIHNYYAEKKIGRIKNSETNSGHM